MDLGNLKVTVGADASQLTAGLNRANAEVQKFGSNVSKVTAKGKANFQDFSRVLQDLPFGLMAIQNNLTQLIPGVGAAGLAFSALISALTFSQVGFGAWTRGMNGAGAATKKAKDEIKDFAESLKDAESNAASTGQELLAFVNVAKNGQLPLEQRNYALKEANKILGEHGQKLTLANVGTEQATILVQKYTDALIQQALAAKYADRIADLLIQQRDASIAYGKSLEYANKATKALQNTNRTTREKELGIGEAVVIERDKANKGLVESATHYKTITKELQNMVGGLNEATMKATGLFGEIGLKPKELKVKPKNIDIEIPESSKLKLKMDFTVGTGSFFQMREFRERVTKMMEKEVGSTKGIEIPFSVTGALDKLQQLREKLATVGNVIVTSISNPMQQAFETIFSGGQSALQAFGNMIKQIVVKLVAAAATALVLSAIVGGMGIGGKVGGGAFNFKSLFASLSGLPKFAKGGMVTGATLAMVGDNPSGKEAIIPFERMGEFINGIGGGGKQVMIPDVTLKGQDLVIAFNRANNQRSRTY